MDPETIAYAGMVFQGSCTVIAGACAYGAYRTAKRALCMDIPEVTATVKRIRQEYEGKEGGYQSDLEFSIAKQKDLIKAVREAQIPPQNHDAVSRRNEYVKGLEEALASWQKVA